MLATVICGVLAAGCASQAELMDDRDWTVASAVETGKWRDIESLFGAEQASAGKHVLRGVRHDLTMAAQTTPDVRCSCMDVVIGTAGNSGKFRWAGEKPRLVNSQLAVAVRTRGAQCPAGVSERRRPSIYAVDQDGPHVIVVIEELEFDRPQALGAVIAQPKPGGSVWLRSRKYRHKRLPYGWTGLRNNMCRLMRHKTTVRPRSGT